MGTVTRRHIRSLSNLTLTRTVNNFSQEKINFKNALTQWIFKTENIWTHFWNSKKLLFQMRKGWKRYLKHKISDRTKCEKGLKSRILRYMRHRHSTCQKGEQMLPVWKNNHTWLKWQSKQVKTKQTIDFEILIFLVSQKNKGSWNAPDPRALGPDQDPEHKLLYQNLEK